MGNETTGRIMPIYSDMLLNSEDPKVLILPASVDKAIIVTTRNNKRLDEVLEELERSGGTIKSIELNGDTVAIGENGTVNLGNLLSGESLKTINNEGLVGNTNINLINAVFGKYGTEGNVTTFLVSRINDNIEAFVPATASEHTLYIDVYNNKIYRYVNNAYVVALDTYIDTSDFALKTELNEKANVSDVYSKTDVESRITEAVEDAMEDYERPETVVINSDGANIVDEHDNNSVLVAPSARQMKLMYKNLMAMYNGLANIAFTNGKPTLDWIGEKTKYTLSYGTLTGCTADVAAGQVNEGALHIKLTPTQASYAFTSVTVNGESVATTATGDADGSVYLDIVVNGNINVAATAVSGRAITFNGTGCMIGAQAVVIGQDLDATITANEHFTLPQSITVKIGNTDVAHTYTRAQGNKTATLHIDAANITGDLTIVCTAVEDDFAVLDLTGVGDNVAVMRDSESLLGQSTPPHVYAGETISILPVSGYKLTTATVNGSTPSNGDAYGGYTYIVDSGDVTEQGSMMTIVGAAEQVGQKTITFDTKWCVPYIGGEEVSGGSITVTEGSNVEVTIKPLDGFVMAKTQVGSTHGNIVIPTKDVYGDVKVDGVAVETDAFDKTNNECVVSLADITSDVTIFAKARLQIVRKAYYKNNTSAAKGYSMELYTNGDNDSNTQQEHAAIISMIPTSGLASTKFKYGSGYNEGAGAIGNIIFIRPNGNKYDNWGAGTAALSNGVRIIDLTSNYTDANIAGFVADVRATLAAGIQTSYTPLKDSNNKSLPYFAVSTDGGTTYTDIVSTDDLNNAYYIHYNDYTA